MMKSLYIIIAIDIYSHSLYTNTASTFDEKNKTDLHGGNNWNTVDIEDGESEVWSNKLENQLKDALQEVFSSLLSDSSITSWVLGRRSLSLALAMESWSHNWPLGDICQHCQPTHWAAGQEGADQEHNIPLKWPQVSGPLRYVKRLGFNFNMKWRNPIPKVAQRSRFVRSISIQ